MVIISLALPACNDTHTGDRVLFSFESDAELNRIHWKCHTLFSISNHHATHGNKSLKMELYPSTYPGVSFNQYNINWISYNALGIDIFNPDTNSFNLAIRLDDKKEHPEYQDRFNKRLVVKPGDNRIIIPFETMITSGTGRQINIKKIYRFVLFSVNPESKSVLYIDNIRLIP